MDDGSLLFYRADGALIVRTLDGEVHVASEAERAEANAGMLADCSATCENT
jgi:hypothetical protein